MSCFQFVVLLVFCLYASCVYCNPLLLVEKNTSPTTADICGDYDLSGENGYLTSPNFPDNYTNNLNCSKTISPPPGQRVEVSFLTVVIENDRNCRFDRLTLTVGDETFSGAEFCGNHIPRNFTTEENVTITFETDEIESLQGFQIYWQMVDACDRNSFRCWDGSCIASTQRCDGNTDCPDQSDEIECAHTSSSYGECGKNSAPVGFTWDYKIVGGNQARQNSYPWSVPLFTQSNFFFCSATIISERWLLTAAHCTELRAPDALFGLLGTNDKSNFSSIRVDFDQVINHPNYTEATYFDIALLRTTQPIVFNENISPICIPRRNDPVSVGEICIATGWGDLYTDGRNSPNLLHQVRLPLVANSICGTSYPDITDAHICAGDFDKGGIDTCQGDSGGPLVCFKDGSWVQFGVTSYGSGCADPQYPTVFTDVRSYHTWIQETLSANFSALSTVDVDICGNDTIIGNNNGTLASPNFPGGYENDLNCSKTLRPPPGTSIGIMFLDFDIESHEDCSYDSLTITVGNETYGEYCGTNTPPNIITNDDVTITFTTDGSVIRQGFRIYWEIHDGKKDVDICGNDTIIGNNGTLASPNFPGNYEDDLDCSKTLRPTPGKSIGIMFLDFDIESHGSCSYDSLTITVGNATYGEYCGTNTPPNIITNDDVTITFRTDDIEVRQGFRIYWEIYDDAPTPPVPEATPTIESFTTVMETTTSFAIKSIENLWKVIATDGNPFSQLISFWWTAAHHKTTGPSEMD